MTLSDIEGLISFETPKALRVPILSRVHCDQKLFEKSERGFIPMRFHSFAVHAFVLAILNSSFALANKPLITNGISIPASDHPGVVSLHFDRSKNPYDSFFCTGTMIANGVILTAAHCAIEISMLLFINEVNKNSSGPDLEKKMIPNIRSGNTTWEISDALPFPASIKSPQKTPSGKFACTDRRAMPNTTSIGQAPYCLKPSNDVALLFVKEAAKPGTNHKFPQDWIIPVAETAPAINQDVLFVGYGMNVNANTYDPLSFGMVTDGSKVKRKGINVIGDLDESLIYSYGMGKYPEPFTYTPSTGVYAVIGQGDSGGPALSNGKVIGVASTITPFVMNREYRGISSHVRVDRPEVQEFIEKSMDNFNIEMRTGVKRPKQRSPVFQRNY
jgi:hypothetical protein